MSQRSIFSINKLRVVYARRQRKYYVIDSLHDRLVFVCETPEECNIFIEGFARGFLDAQGREEFEAFRDPLKYVPVMQPVVKEEEDVLA